MTREELHGLITKCDKDLVELRRDLKRYEEHGNASGVAAVKANIEAIVKTRADYCEQLAKL